MPSEYYNVSGIPVHAQDSSIHYGLRSYLATIGIHHFNFVRLPNRSKARICIPDDDPAAPSRLRYHIQILRYNDPHPNGPSIYLTWVRGGASAIRMIQFQPSDETAAQTFLNKSLDYEVETGIEQGESNLKPFRYLTGGLMLGYLSYLPANKLFQLITYYQTPTSGVILFGRTAFRLWYRSRDEYDVYQLDFSYISILVAIVDEGNNSISLTLQATPKISKLPSPKQDVSSLSTIDSCYSNMSLSKFKIRAERVTRLDDADPKVTGNCLTYYIPLTSLEDLSGIASRLEKLGIHVHRYKRMTVMSSITRLEDELSKVRDGIDQTFPMNLKFQLQKLATIGIWRPQVISAIFQRLRAFRNYYGSQMLEDSLQGLHMDIPDYSGKEFLDFAFTAPQLLDRIEMHLKSYTEPQYLPQDITHLIPTYRARVTPTSIYLEGPTNDQSNRVLRMYKSNITSFLRVVISDEDGEPLHFLSSALENRFSDILHRGIDIYGEGLYQFLGFSNSSLRSQSCWFCAPFVQTNRWVTHEVLYKELGDFSSIRTPALCASRIGQAFSDTAHAIDIAQKDLQIIGDVNRNGHCFSDGCGLISAALLKKVWNKLYRDKKILPTTLQIRFGGAKGVVTLDPSLQGEQLILRKSMWKFNSTHYALEVCSSNYKRIPVFLNHQVIKILEDMGTPSHAFLDLQGLAVKRLMKIFIDREAPRRGEMAAHSPILRSIFQICSSKKWKCYEDPFLRQIIQFICLLDLRSIKYRGRILVDKGATLFGIMDEYNILEEGQIYITFQDESGGKRCVVKDRVVITRAPTMAPGDVQVVQSVNVPPGCPLRQLTNCVVFSQKGQRDLASKLGGGDLDGDLYAVFWDSKLVPPRTAKPASYEKKPSVKLNRPVNRDDMINFFLSFMTADKLGEIATKHKVLADQLANGSESSTCVKLAELASDAVDAAKFGHTVDMSFIDREIRELCRFRPHFMSPAPLINLSQDKSLSQAIIDGPSHHVLRRAPDFDEPPNRYYRSNKVLGKLYENIDEHAFIAELEHKMQEGGRTNLQKTILDWVRQETTWAYSYRSYITKAEELRDSFEKDIIAHCYSFSTTGLDPITELEVISGSILGMTGNGFNRRLQTMSEQLRKVVAQTMSRYENWIWSVDRDMADQQVHDFELEDGGVFQIDSDQVGIPPGPLSGLGKAKTPPSREQLRASAGFASACLALAVQTPGKQHPRIGRIRSFWVLAATMCVTIIDYAQGQSSRPRPSGPEYEVQQVARRSQKRKEEPSSTSFSSRPGPIIPALPTFPIPSRTVPFSERVPINTDIATQPSNSNFDGNDSSEDDYIDENGEIWYHLHPRRPGHQKAPVPFPLEQSFSGYAFTGFPDYDDDDDDDYSD